MCYTDYRFLSCPLFPLLLMQWTYSNNSRNQIKYSHNRTRKMFKKTLMKMNTYSGLTLSSVKDLQKLSTFNKKMRRKLLMTIKTNMSQKMTTKNQISRFQSHRNTMKKRDSDKKDKNSKCNKWK